MRGLSRTVRRRGRAPVASMACGMVLLLNVDLCREGMSGSSICIFEYAESRGLGLDLVPKPF